MSGLDVRKAMAFSKPRKHMQSPKTNESGRCTARSLRQDREMTDLLAETAALVDRWIREEDRLVGEAIYTALISMCDEMSGQSARKKTWH